MKRLNPIYIIFLALTILLISFFILEDEKNSLNNEYKSFNGTKAKALAYKDYKQTWASKEYALSTVNKILNSRAFRNIKHTKTQTNRLLKLKIETNKTSLLNSFLNKLLNKNVNINKLELNKKFIYLEIGLR